MAPLHDTKLHATQGCTNLGCQVAMATKFYKKKKISPITGRRCPEGFRNLRFPDYVTKAQNSGKVVSLTHRPFLPPGNTPGTHFCYRLSRSQGQSAIGRIMSMTPSGIQPATFQFVAQHLNHCATAVPQIL